jgi:hypothetical protein
MNDRIPETLAAHPELARDLYLLASEIVDDFLDYGGVLQANEVGEYDEATVIRRLEAVRNEIIARMRSASSPEQPTH